MEVYFKFKMFMEYVAPITLVAIIVTIVIIKITISVIKEFRIEKFFLANGYERQLFGVPSVGNGAFYGWVRKYDGKSVDDRDIKGWSLKQIKEKYK